MSDWKDWTPEYNGHAPDDWEEGMEWEYYSFHGFTAPFRRERQPKWAVSDNYRYRHTPDRLDALTSQCLALPQADRDALIEALQKPQRDWADDVWSKADEAFGNGGKDAAAAVIRSMCRPKDVEISAADLFIQIIETADYESNLRSRAFDKYDLEAIELIKKAMT